MPDTLTQKDFQKHSSVDLTVTIMYLLICII